MTRKALVVGISTYTHLPNLNLETFANNAEAIALSLKHDCQFDLVKRLPDVKGNGEEPIIVGKKTPVNKAELEQAIVELFQPEVRFKPTTALLYFTGHGILKKEGFSGGYLVTSDSELKGNWGLSLKELRELLQDSSIPEQIIWLDSCYSGELLNVEEANPGEKGQCSSRCFMAAATELAHGNDRYGVFTQALLNGLNTSVHNIEKVDNESLSVFVRQELERSRFPQIPAFSNFGTAIELRSSSNKNQDKEETAICPYKGLEYFDCNDEDPKYFYGREKLTDTLLDRVRENNFLAILGASGSGKSSLLRAGLLHQLKSGRKLAGSEDWKIQIMLPGEHPLQNLALSWLNPDVSVADRATQLDQIESMLKQGGEGLRKIVQATTANRVILVVDQFEEAFTLCKDLTERESFFKCLLEALEQIDNQLCLILAMRIDFFGKCFEKKYSGLGNKIQAKDNFIAVPPMEQEELKQAIIKPAEKVKLSIESGLTETILRDLKGSPGSLPLLQDTLNELWKRRVNNQLKFTIYSQLGGIGGTLNQRATEVYNSFHESEKDCTQHIFLSLTSLSNLREGIEVTRKRVLKQDLITAKYNEQLIDNVVQKLANEKLLVTRDRFEQSSEIGKQAEIDVVHEALIKNWILLRQWLDEIGIGRTLSQRATKIYNSFSESEQDAARHIFLSLIHLGQGTEDSRRNILKQDLITVKHDEHLIDNVVQKLANEKLIVIRIAQVKQSSEIGKQLELDLAHEALIRNWKLLRTWVNQNRSLLLQRKNIEDAAKNWIKEKRKGDYLFQGIQWQLAKNFETEHQATFPLSPISTEFIKKGARKRRLNRLKTIGWISLTPLILLILWSYRQWWVIPQSLSVLKDEISTSDEQKDEQKIEAIETLIRWRATLALKQASIRNVVGLNTVDFSKVDLAGVDLRDAKLEEANLEETNLNGTKLQEANLKRANLRKADLRVAEMTLANLTSANLEEAQLDDAMSVWRANLYHTNLRKAKDPSPRKVKSACNWKEAIFDENFKPELEKEPDRNFKPDHCSRWE